MSETSDNSARIIDGAAVAASMTESVREAAAALIADGIRPGLAVVLVGNDPASEVYVRNKGKKAEQLGFHSVQRTLPAETAEAELLAVVEELNADPAIHGILVQMPLPDHIDPRKVIEAIRPEKDVDGLHPVNIGRLVGGDGDRALVPCTPAGCMVLLRRTLGDTLSGREAVVIGRSNLVGKDEALQNRGVDVADHLRRQLGVVGEDLVLEPVESGDDVVDLERQSALRRGEP